jgi:pimeloyl-ACP methyl ester carboxylesterase
VLYANPLSAGAQKIFSLASVSSFRVPETVALAGIETAVRRSDGEGTPTVFVHGNPSSSVDWIPFAERLPGPAIAFDLPNFGRSARVPVDQFDASLEAYAEWIGSAIDELGIDRFKLVVHDWGGIALSSTSVERAERLVVMNAVPLLAGYRWHWVARIWRRRGLGETFNAITTRPAFGTIMRQARPRFRPLPKEWVDDIWSTWDRETQKAVLALYRSADPDRLGAAGARLGEIDCPALVVWGQNDPYLPAIWGESYAAVLPDAELVELELAGHWPWIDRPELIDRVVRFLEGEDAAGVAARPA